MEIFHNLWIGFQVAVSPWNLFYCLVGVLLGTLIGVLPGIGPVATIAMLLPITFNLNPVAALIVSVLTVLYRPNAKALVLISVACIVYGYVMKPLGLVLATAGLVYISGLGGHEFKWKEVTVLFVILILFSYLVFVKGLTLPFPMWPERFS